MANKAKAPPSEEEIELSKLALFDPDKVEATCENVRSRLEQNHVVHQWQFRAFIRAYDELREHNQRLEEVQKLLNTWAMHNKETISRVMAEKRKEKSTLAGFRSLMAAQEEAALDKARLMGEKLGEI